MKLIIILICLLLMTQRHWRAVLHHKPFLEKYVRWIDGRLQRSEANDWARLILIVSLPLLLLSGILHLFDYSHFKHFWRALVSLVVLWYCWSTPNQMPSTASSPREVTQAVLWDDLPETFAVVFWFVLLGPLGALLYHITKLTQISSVAKTASQLRQIEEWPAVRLLGFGYALAGHFNPSFSYWSLHLLTNTHTNQIFLQKCGLLALNGVETDPSSANAKENYHAKALVNRAQIMLLVVLAIFTLGAWIY